MFKKILVAVDGSPASDRALSTALGVAKEGRSAVRLVSVADVMPPAAIDPTFVDFGEYDKGARAVARAAIHHAESKAKVARVAAEGTVRKTLAHDISGEIVQEARRWGADLIVLGTHGRTGLARLFLGSVAEGVARHAPTAVLLVRLAAPSTKGTTRTTKARTRARRASR